MVARYLELKAAKQFTFIFSEREKLQKLFIVKLRIFLPKRKELKHERDAGKLKSNVADFGLKVVDKLKPVLTDVITMIDNAGPAIEKFASGLASNIGKGIKAVSALIPKMSAAMDTIKPVLDSIVSGFAPIMPQLTAFGGAVVTALQKVATAAMPIISSIISTMQTVIPAVLPVLQTVITNISNIIAAAAPIISGLVTGIGTVVSALAPVFKTIFDGIGEKVGSVLSFVGSQMGWIQEIIGTAAPVISSVLSSAWSIISPILDVAITVFKLLFSVTKTVFNGIVSVVSSVWEKIQPIVEGVAKGLSWIKDKVTGLFSGGGDSVGSVGTNAEGTNSWRGGVTWVGEKGPELIDLPKVSGLYGKFYIESDSHTFTNSKSEMQLTLAFSNLMDEKEIPTT